MNMYEIHRMQLFWIDVDEKWFFIVINKISEKLHVELKLYIELKLYTLQLKSFVPMYVYVD